MRSLRLLALLPALLAAAGCGYYDKPNKPLPEDFKVVTLDGKTLSRSDFVGKPWLINIWVPG